MALAFRRATTAADEAFKGYVSQFGDYYGFAGVEKPVTFDWESAKAVAGESKFNSNEELLPKSVTIANCVKDYSNYVSGMVSGLAYKAGSDDTEAKALAFGIMHKHFTTITVHFDDKSTKKGECTWSCEVKEGVLHATMHWDFSAYCGRQNYEDVCEYIITYLDDSDNLLLLLDKQKWDNDKSGWYKINTDGKNYLEEQCPGKTFEINWDEILATPGRSEFYSNKPPFRNSWILANELNDGGVMYQVKWALDVVLKDAMGKEAFAETFDGIKIRMSTGAAHKGSVAKEGKYVVFTFVVKMADHQNASRDDSYGYGVLGKAIEGML